MADQLAGPRHPSHRSAGPPARRPAGRPAHRPSRRPARRPRHPRLRRSVPALLMILILSAVAGAVWWKVLQRRDAAAAAEACAVAAALDPHTVKLRVYNASAREGLAATVAAQLTRRGFVVLATANDPLMDLRPVTTGWAEIRYGSAGARQAQLVGAHVPGAKLYRDGREDAVVDVALGQAFKRLSTRSELARAMAAIEAASTLRQPAEARQGIVAVAPARPSGAAGRTSPAGPRAASTAGSPAAPTAGC